MAYRHNPHSSDPYNPRPDSHHFRPRPQPQPSSRYHQPPTDPDWARAQLLLTILAVLAAWKYHSLYRLARSLVRDPTGTLTGLVEMVGFKLTGLGAQLGQSKVEWAKTEEGQSDKEGKPVRRYKDIVAPPVQAGELLWPFDLPTASWS